MDRTNETILTSPNLSYTSRDFSSIYNELINSIPLLTKSWSATDENDPGVVLLKAIAMIGDMLSYNQDKQALEAFPRTVLQRSNAQQIFRLVGYKMHWWRSAIVEASFTNANDFAISFNRYNTFTTVNDNITYTNLKEFSIPGNTYGEDAYTVELIQGIPVTPSLIGSVKPTDYNTEWHSGYDYNVPASNVVNNKLYVNYTNIDETSISLIDNDETPFAENEWTLVKNINLSETMDKVFEFDVDESGNSFILLPSYWNTKYTITKFKLFFVLSDGKNGEIEENKLGLISTKGCYVNGQDNISISSVLSQVSMFNTPSTYGYNPETCTEARQEAEKYINTIDTLVVLKDFEKAVRRIESVANVVATDIQIDPFKNEMSNYQINLWIVRKNDYNNTGDNYIYAPLANETNNEIFKENIISELKSYKLMPYDININLENKIDWIDWSVTGQIFLRKPINIDQNRDLMTKINNNLKNRFNTETLDFNEAVNYMDVIECIMKTDKNIWHVDLNTSAIEYTKVKRSLKGNKTNLYIANKYMIYDKNGKYTGYYMTSLGCTTEHMSKINQYINSEIETNDEDLVISNNNVNVASNTAQFMSSGYGKSAGNKIVREDGLQTVIGLDFGEPNEAREYEIYDNKIYDWTGYEPKNTGRFIDTSSTPYKIMKYDDLGQSVETGYTIMFDSRMYMTDGSDAHRYLKNSYRQIQQLCDTSETYDETKLSSLSNEDKDDLVNKGFLRKTYDIYDSQYNTWTNESIDKLTGEMFMLRGNYWYSMNRYYDENTGYILDTYGDVEYDDNMSIIREPACREDIDGEYIQFFDVDTYMTNNPEKDLTFEFFLGQDANGNSLTDSIGHVIKAYPIKPYSLFIYVNGDEDIIADDGCGKLNSTPGLLDTWGTIDYDTGLVTFKTTIRPTSLKIIYKVNKLTYSHYVGFDTNTFFVNPSFIRSDLRK